MWDGRDNVTDDTKGIEGMWHLQDNATGDTKGIEIKWELQDNATQDTKESDWQEFGQRIWRRMKKYHKFACKSSWKNINSSGFCLS